MNAILGITRPGDFGADMMHFNPHKTFPGRTAAADPGPAPSASPTSWPLTCRCPSSRSTASVTASTPNARNRSAACGVSSATPACWSACLLHPHHGPDGLRAVSENAVLNANYLLSRVKHFLPVPQGDRCMHEFVASAARLKKERASRRWTLPSGCWTTASTPDGVLPPDRPRSDHDRADGDREQGNLGRVRRNTVSIDRADAGCLARRPPHHSGQSSR